MKDPGIGHEVEGYMTGELGLYTEQRSSPLLIDASEMRRPNWEGTRNAFEVLVGRLGIPVRLSQRKLRD